MVDDPVPVIEVGLKLTLKPLPLTEADKLIEELKPFKAVVLIVEVLELPREMVRLVGLALMLKSAAATVTVSETPVVWVTPPPVAVTVIVYVPVATVDPTVIVMVEDPEPGAVIELGLKLSVTPAGCPEADKVMAELKPPVTLVVIVDCPELPCATETEPGDAERLKFGAVTVSETVVNGVAPLFPVTVMVYVPAGTVDATAMVMVEDPAPGAGIGLVLKLTVTPVGWPEADKVMAELKPPLTVVVIVDCPELPCATETEPGDAEMLKLGAAGPASALSKPPPFGLPQPVTKSYPVVAEYAPLLPLIMSWKSAS
jgi:hypothetical protein